MSRYLVAWPSTTAGTREYRNIDLSIDTDVTQYHDQLLEILQASLPLVEGTRNELVPRELSLDADAMTLWIVFHNHVEKRLGDDGELAPVRGFANKAAEHAARLAGVLTLVNNLEATVINAELMTACIKFP